MNQRCYRLVFNRCRGMLMAVAETAPAQGRTTVKPARRTARHVGFAVRVATLAVWTMFYQPSVQAQIVADKQAPGQQQATVLNAANGVPLVNIQTPSAAGVSRNTYSQFDVSQQGAILNNSRGNTPTQLGGWVQGNPWLAAGGARVILNEVNSSQPSQLRGYLEVAGQRAEVIIANPAGLHLDGAGFINASKVTLTTGSPVWNSGNLDSYRVAGGLVSIAGAGADLAQADQASILARAAHINAGLWAKDLKLVTGVNQISPDASQVIAQPSVAAGATPAYALDVAALGGMYAGKVYLIGTEAGLGVRNAGTVTSNTGDLILQADGQLLNSGHLGSQQAIQLQGQSLDNQGTSYAAGTQTIAVNQVLNNSSLLAAGQQLAIQASKVTQSANGTMAAGVQQDGSLGGQAPLSVQATQAIDILGGKQFASGVLRQQAASLNLTGAQLQASNIELDARDGDIRMPQAFVLAREQLSIHSQQVLETTGATVEAGQVMQLKADTLTNGLGGSLKAGQLLAELSDSVENRGLLDGNRVTIHAPTLTNTGTGTIYGDDLQLAALKLQNREENGQAAVIAARQRLDIAAGELENREHALLFSVGDLYLGGQLDNQGHATGQAGILTNASATIEALGNIQVDARTIYNLNRHFSLTTETLPIEQITEYQGSGAAKRYVPGSEDVYIYNDESDHLHTPEGNYETWLAYQYSRTTVVPKIATSDPARIYAGGDATIETTALENQYSEIIAGGALAIKASAFNNPEAYGTKTVTELGGVTNYWRDRKKGRDSTGSAWAVYQPPAVETQVPLSPSRVLEHQSLALANGPATLGLSSPANPGWPSSSLYLQAPATTSRYLIETDPRFASYRQWLSSDYMLAAMGSDPATAQKRLGDGFYEQKLIRDQVAQLTGRRFLDGYASDEAQYRALMNNGVTFAQAYGLRPGVALSPEQMARLTSDIVWLVAQTITLPDGSQQTALVPQVYLRVQPGDLTAGGSLLSAETLQLNVSDTLNNSGTLAGRQLVNIQAGTLDSIGGRIRGEAISLATRNDINLTGAEVRAGSSLAINAGRDLSIASTTASSNNAQGSRTVVDRIAGLYVEGGAGQLLASAGRNLTLTAANLQNDATGGLTQLQAGQDLTLATVKTGSSNQLQWQGNNARSDSQSQDVGSNIASVGDITLKAGGNVRSTAANLGSQAGAISLQAAGNVQLDAGQSRVQVDESHQYSGSNGALSRKTTTTRDTLDQTQAIGSQLSGQTVSVSAGKDLTVTGSSIASDLATTLNAGGNVTLAAAQNSSSESHSRDEKKSGLMSSGGLGFTIGKAAQGNANSVTTTQAVGSTVGSVQGDVSIQAGQAYRQTGSSILTPQGDIDVQAQSITIEEARQQTRVDSSSYSKQSGLTVAISNPVVSAVQTVQGMQQATSQTGDARMQALAAASAGLATYRAAQDVAAQPGQLGGVTVSASIGSSRSSSQSTQSSDQAVASTLAAGGNLSLRATGAGQASDLTVQGSQLQAGGNALLQADDQITLQAARNTAEQHSRNSSSSGSIGVSWNTAAGPQATLSASQGRGHTDGSDVTYSNTHVNAGQQLTLSSGGDTTLQGAVASGQRVTGDIGDQLHIDSLQDSSRYDSRQQNAGVSIAAGTGSASGSVSAGNTRIDSDYLSVAEQSGLKAGDGGFQLTVKGDTTLSGGVIASSDAAEQAGVNRLDTTATHLSDLHNQASYKASAYSVNVGVSSGKPSGSAGIGQDSGSAASDTRAGISGIAGNSSVRSGDAETGIVNPFDAQRVAANVGAQVAISAEFGRQAPRAWADYAQAQYKAAQASGNAEDAAKWAEGGAYRVAGHTLLGGLSGGVAGAAGAASSASLMPKLGEQLDSSNLPAAVKQAIGLVASATLGAVSGGAAGAAMGLNVDVNNRQLHPEEERAIAQLAKGDKDKAQRLRAAACYLVKCSAEFLSGPQADYYSQLERQGASMQSEQQQLLQYQETVILQKASGYPAAQTVTIKNLFQYSREDLVADSHARLTELRVSQLGSLGLSPSQARSLLATAGTAALVAGTVAGYKLGGLDELLATAKVENNAGAKLNNQFYRDGAIADTSRTLSVGGPWKAAVELTPKEANNLLNSSLPVGAKITGRQDANLENAKAIAEGYQPPFVQGTQVLQIVIDKPTKFVRVFGGDSGQVGSWVMKAEDVVGLTPQQIASKYSLPQLPTMIGDVTLPAGTKMNVSVAGGISPGSAKGVVTGDNGGGGGVQFQIITPDRKLNQQWFNGERNIW